MFNRIRTQNIDDLDAFDTVSSTIVV
jgi:hypothetical protein